ncbi:MAG TPA: TetR/AcrR family transcriptional regulator [Thermoleophilaceae bacterium]|nr:TetR/AcrR family transcriptional regulator [Thermoleophilaceae bacterium]
MAVDEVGLRERKKERTRQTLADVAAELFDRQGFQDTTIKQIADAADVSPRTVSAYFPCKEELVFCDHGDMFDQLEQRLDDRPAGTKTVETLRAWLMEMLETVDVDLEQSRRTRELIESDPALRTYERGLQERAEQMVARAVAVDLGVSSDELVPHMVGAATIAALDAMGRRAKDPDAGDFQATALPVIDDAMTFIGAGVQALADR